MAWLQTEAPRPRLARGTTPGRAAAGDRTQGEDVDAPRPGLGVFSWSGTYTVHTPQASGSDGEVGRARAEATCAPAGLRPGTEQARATWVLNE